MDLKIDWIFSHITNKALFVPLEVFYETCLILKRIKYGFLNIKSFKVSI